MSNEKIFCLIYRELEEINWEQATKKWADIFGKNSKYIVFPDFLTNIKLAFKQDQDAFLDGLELALTETAYIPDNFQKLSDLEKSVIFFSFFRSIFTINEIHTFACNPDIGINGVMKYFSASQNTIFLSIAVIFKETLNAITIKQRLKYGPKLLTAFSKLLIPDEGKYFKNKDFKLSTIFISPAIYHTDNIKKISVFLDYRSTNELYIIKAADSSIVTRIEMENLCAVQDNDKVELYNDHTTPFVTLTLPDQKSANALMDFILNPPPSGFNHINSFLRSLACFKNMNEFFDGDNVLLPHQLTDNLQKILESNGSIVLLYIFMLPANESKIKIENALYLIKLLGGNILPFLRAVIELNWYNVISSRLILSSNNQLTFTLSALLKATSENYQRYIVDEMSNIFQRVAPQFTSSNFDLREAQIFCKELLTPCANAIFNSVPKMDITLRYILRTLFIRAECHFPGGTESTKVIPNTLLWRFIFPEFSKRIGDNNRIASVLCQSLLSMFYMTGWPPNVCSELYKMPEYMTCNNMSVISFTKSLIDVDEFSLNADQIDYSGNVLLNEFIEQGAERISLLNMSEPNTLVNTHIDSVTMMQALEEYIYDFQKLKLK